MCAGSETMSHSVKRLDSTTYFVSWRLFYPIASQVGS